MSIENRTAGPNNVLARNSMKRKAGATETQFESKEHRYRKELADVVAAKQRRSLSPGFRHQQ